MAAKRKLLQWMRDTLNNHVQERVDPPAERKAMDAAYKKVAPLVSRMVQKKYKPIEMEILRKYEVASRDACIRMTLPDSRVVSFDYRTEDEAPLVAEMRNCRGRMFLADDPLMIAYDAYKKAEEAHKDERQRRVAAYGTLIRSAATVEDIIEVWPEAAALLPATAMMAPLTPEQLALIDTDMLERKAA